MNFKKGMIQQTMKREKKSKNLIGPMKDNIVGKIVTKFATVRSKTYAFKIQENDYDNNNN